jgi:pimeloyl-ACP methyl ester carboxylesterase
MSSRIPDPAILIHGAWQGAWVWDRLIPLLASPVGIESIAVNLPGNGTDDTNPADVSLERYVDHIGKLLEQLPERVSLVAHSGGGVISSAVAERFPERVRRIAYVAGMMLPDGASYADIVTELKDSHPNPAGIAPHLLWSPDRLTSRVPVQTALTYFFHDCPSAEATAAAHRLTPQPEPGRAVRPCLKSAGDLSTRQVLSNAEGAPGTG